MCGINGIYELSHKTINSLEKQIDGMNKIIKHRGPDGEGIWTNDDKYIGLGHVRLSIIDLNETAMQPMTNNRYIIVFNGEIYNYKEIKEELINKYNYIFKTNSDTETIIALYSVYGKECLEYLNGMFSFAIWDNIKKELFCAKDRLGIKPFYYTIQKNIFYFASEVKALLPYIEKKEEDYEAITEYLIFQYNISDLTMIKGIKQLLPAHYIHIENNNIHIKKYWIIDYRKKTNFDENYYIDKIKELINESINLHLRSDVPIASYVSGGIDSSLISILSSNKIKLNNLFHGKFSEYPECDESKYAQCISNKIGIEMYMVDITPNDFVENIKNIIYYLDYPVVGPGSFPQFMVSKLASKYTKVILGGQGGDEIFGGYVRYLIPYLEKILNDAFDGNSKPILDMAKNMSILKEYKPMIKHFMKNGMFEDLDKRYFHLINRSEELNDMINWNILNKNKIYNMFIEKFNNINIPETDFFNKMLNFDLEYSLPGLLHVEDRVSMAWGLESRVPFINHKLIEFMATIPEDIKINSGNMKHLLKKSFNNILPDEIINRKDKMGFPVPLNIWFNNELKPYFINIIKSLINRKLDYLNIDENFLEQFIKNPKFSRSCWVLLNIELWYQNYFDNK
jgi:asparagine synthase (glutamine-hydrolysing)